MPSSTARGYPYPLTSDNVNPPSDIQALASAVDTDVTTLAAKVPLIQVGNQSAVFTAVATITVGPIPFPTAYSVAPSMTFQAVTSGGAAVGWKALVTALSTTQFTVRVDLVGSATITFPLYWTAIGPF